MLIFHLNYKMSSSTPILSKPFHIILELPSINITVSDVLSHYEITSIEQSSKKICSVINVYIEWLMANGVSQARTQE